MRALHIRAPVSQFSIDIHLHPADLTAAMRSDVRDGFAKRPRELPPKYFYDARGMELFEEITRLDEYYPTAREREILFARADEIAQISRADTLVELGSGTSEKTRILLSALSRCDHLRRFVPFDVCEPILRDVGPVIDKDYPGVVVHAVVGDFKTHLHRLPKTGRRLIAFLGGTIGNLYPEERTRFYAAIAGNMSPGDHLLLGTDLVKDVARLEAAYNDARGVTAEFNKNVLRVLNRDLDADFDLDAFDHHAPFDIENSWIEMKLIANRHQRVRIAALDLDMDLAAGEYIRTEISTKFQKDVVDAELGAAGLVPVSWWTDLQGDFALSLWTKR